MKTPIFAFPKKGGLLASAPPLAFRRLWIKALLFILVLPSVLGERALAFEIQPRMKDVLVGEEMDFFEDKEASLGVEDIARGVPFAAEKRQKTTNLGISNSAFWGRISLKNPEAGPREIVVVSRYVSMDHVSLFVPRGDGSFAEFKSGDRTPYSERQIQYRQAAFRISLPPGENTLYMRAATTGIVQFDVALWDTDSFSQHRSDEYSFLWAMFGALIIMFAYNLLMMLTTRNWSYYGLYCLFVAVNTLNMLGVVAMSQEVFRDMPWFDNEGFLLFASLTGGVTAAFTSQFLGLKKHGRILHWGCLLSIALYVIAAVIIPFAFPLAVKIIVLVSLLLSFWVFIAGAIMSFRGYRPAFFFTIAFFGLCIGSVARLLSLAGVFPLNWLTAWGQFLGITLEVMLISLAIGDKIRLQQEKSDASIRQLNRDLKGKQDELVALNAGLEDMVQEKTRSIRSIMETIELGIFTINAKTSKIDPEFSRHLPQMLNARKIEGEDPFPLLFERSDLSSDGLDRLKNALSFILDGDQFGFEVNSHNLPKAFEMHLGGSLRHFELDWAPIVKDDSVERILVTVKDATAIRALTKKSEAQEKELRYISQILGTTPEKFSRFILSAQGFVLDNKRLLKGMEKGGDPERMKMLYINCHTMKGAARSLALQNAVEVIHDAEQLLSEVRDGRKSFEKHREAIVSAMGLIEEEVSLYEKVNREKLGRAMIDVDHVDLKSEDIEELFGIIRELKQGGTVNREKISVIDSKIGSKIYADGKTFFEEILAPTASLAKDLGKLPPVIDLQLDGLRLSSKAQNILRNAMVHVVRNALDHGIEAPSERQAKGKTAEGRIEIKASPQGEFMTISIRDDGKGLDLDAILKKAVTRGSIPEGRTMSPEEIAALIFEDGISTAMAVTDISGRGVGMSAVKSFLESEGGYIEVRLHEKGPGEESDKVREFSIVCYIPENLVLVGG